MKKAGEIDKIIGDRIELHRSLARKTRREVANELGISHQQLGYYETGANRIPASRLFKIAEIIGINISLFFPLLPFKGLSAIKEGK